MSYNTKIRTMSDLHLEFYENDQRFHVSELPDDANTILVLAGDIIVAKNLLNYDYFFKDCCSRFRDVIYIMGNHEYYGSKFPTTITKIKEKFGHYTNLHVFENESIVIDDVAFICATLWSNFEDGNPLVMMDAQMKMNDFKKIRTGPKNEPWKYKFNPTDAFNEFVKSKSFIFNEIMDQTEKGNKSVVVTHMGPSFNSISEEYKYDRLNGAYVSNLEHEISITIPNLWIHGHVHKTFDYKVGDTRVLTNPFGYKSHEVNPEFNMNLIIEV